MVEHDTWAKVNCLLHTTCWKNSEGLFTRCTVNKGEHKWACSTLLKYSSPSRVAASSESARAFEDPTCPHHNRQRQTSSLFPMFPAKDGFSRKCRHQEKDYTSRLSPTDAAALISGSNCVGRGSGWRRNKANWPKCFSICVPTCKGLVKTSRWIYHIDNWQLTVTQTLLVDTVWTHIDKIAEPADQHQYLLNTHTYQNILLTVMLASSMNSSTSEFASLRW